ncbi:MAG: hypothetical protein GEV03_02445 [Streptosporangiales bacterium]|nr:hypothetical protein [Streptosporangiales bacterium]
MSRRDLVAGAVVLGGVMLLAGPAGLVWAAVAPRADFVLTPGGAELADPGTRALVLADRWFAVISAAAGLLCGAAAHVAGGRRYGLAKAAGLAAGGVLAGLLAWRVGQLPDLAEFRQAARTLPDGARVRAFLTLTAPGVLAVWPLVAVGSFGVLATVPGRLRRLRGPHEDAEASTRQGDG